MTLPGMNSVLWPIDMVPAPLKAASVSDPGPPYCIKNKKNIVIVDALSPRTVARVRPLPFLLFLQPLPFCCFYSICMYVCMYVYIYTHYTQEHNTPLVGFVR
jgi:hypothetical protein